ncbi:hypothetical protein [Egbenema bharatensis]|uniref:hypothetical protein n=1 Tax=Egbenema bharatensis TaxID=3463334 RepID=UPI003A84F70B
MGTISGTIFALEQYLKRYLERSFKSVAGRLGQNDNELQRQLQMIGQNMWSRSRCEYGYGS